jgi:DNA-binding SARP family transcriptional activator
MTDGIVISLTGPFAIRSGHTRERLHLTGNTLRLLILLAGNYNTELRREGTVAEIWPDADTSSANSALNTALWRIRKCLARFEGVELQSFDDIVQLTVMPPAQVDVDLLERAMAEMSDSTAAEPNPPEQRRLLANAVALYRGEYLEGCSEHWVLAKREHYAALQTRALSILMRDAAAEDRIEVALKYGRSILALDPFREGSLREVMWLHVRNGERAKALRRYEALRTLLRTELDIEPMEETTTLFRRISENDRMLNWTGNLIRPDRQSARDAKDFQRSI